MDLEFPTGGPSLALIIATDSDLCDQVWSWQAKAGGRRAIRIVRGPKAETAHALFDEFAAALQFPYYFGGNWAAFDECLADLEWLAADAVLIVVANAIRALAGEAAEEYPRWLKRLERAAADRGEIPLRVALHASPADARALREKVAAGGVEFEEWGSTAGPG